MDITSMTAVELGKSIKEGKLSVAEVVSAFLRRMDMVEKDVREGKSRRPQIKHWYKIRVEVYLVDF